MRAPNRSIADKIRKTLEEEIFLGIIPPGQRLDEQKEAKRFGVSRTPFREALHYLASVGLVTISARRGATVASLTVPQIIEMLEVLAHLEYLTANLAAQNMTDKELKLLSQIHQKCAKLVNKKEIEKYYHLAKSLHETMYKGTKNSFLAENSRNLRNRIFPYLRHQLGSPGRAESCLAEQALIVDALIKRDGTKAAECARDHVKIQQHVFNEFMKALERTGMVRAKFSWAPTALIEIWENAGS